MRKHSGPDSIFVVGSSKHNNEQAYLLRKWMSSGAATTPTTRRASATRTTVAGVANTWGYGAMTNSYNDMQNAKAALYIGSNAAEAHPVSMLHMLHAKETGCKMIVVDPRFTRTAAKADEYVRIRSGTDIPFLFGVLYHVFKNGWEDKKYIEDRVYGMDKVREDVTGQVDARQGAKKPAASTRPPCSRWPRRWPRTGRAPSSGAWARPSTRSATPWCAPRASCSWRSATSAYPGGGANIFRGHDNVQGATDVGPNPDSLPGYYGLADGAFKHFATVWGVDFEWIKKQYAPGMMNKPGMTVSRWIDGVLEKNELIDQDSNLRGMFFWGHAPNSQIARSGDEARDGQARSAGGDRSRSRRPPRRWRRCPASPRTRNPNRAVYLLPACTQFETSGSVTASNRSIQWREQVIEPLWESRSDHMIMYQLAQKLGFDKELVEELQDAEGQGHGRARARGHPARDQQVRLDHRLHGPEPGAAEGAHAQHERLRRQDAARPRAASTRRPATSSTATTSACRGPATARPRSSTRARPICTTPRKHVMDGGGNFRANFGVERDGVNLLADDGSHSKGADLTTGYPEFDHLLLKKLGWWDDLTEAEKKAAEGKNWKTDLSGGIIRVAMTPRLPSVRQCQGARGGLELPRSRCRSTASRCTATRPDLVAKYPTHDDKKAFWRLPTLYKTVQEKNKDIGKTFPLIMTSGRLVEYEGGGEETRSNPWLAELQQEMFVEINPKAANDRGIRNGEYVWVKTPPMQALPEFKGLRVKALVTERVGPDTVFLPFHFSGRWGGVDLAPYYPEGAAPVVRGESVNTATTYGYDSVTMMQETKTTVCQIERATA